MIRYLKNQSPLNMGFAIMAFVLMVVTSGCKKNDILLNDPQKKTRPRSAGDGLNDLLGYGYDITGEYGSSSASKFSVINITALKNAQPTRVEWDRSTRQVGKLVSGENATSYLDKLSANLDGTFGFKAFSGTIKSSYSSSDAFSAKYVYSSFDLVMQQGRGKLSGGLTLLKQYLHPSFLWDVEYESPEYIVGSYGTHVLTDITVGAKLNVMYRSETRSSTRERASQIGIDVNVPKVFKITVGLGYTYTQKEVDDNFAQSLHYETIGGDPSKSLIGDIPVGNNPPTVDISDWQASCRPNNAEMIDFNTQGMIPLYELVDDPVKKQALKDYISDYIKFHEPILERTYVKATRQNPHYSNGTIYYDYYVRFYKEDKVTPLTVRDVTVEYKFDIYPGPSSTVRIVDDNNAYVGDIPGEATKMIIYPGAGYEVLQ